MKLMMNINETFQYTAVYLRNETRYPKSERHTISSHSSRVQPNKSGELWSSIHRVVHVSLDLPKSTFFVDGQSVSAWFPAFLSTGNTLSNELLNSAERIVKFRQ